jgi:predicted AAA+ superfamily ATPase
MASSTSCRRSRSLLIEDSLAGHALAERRSQCPFADHVHRAIEQRLEIGHEPAKVEQAPARLELDQEAALSGVSNDTVDDYVGLLEQAHVLRTLRPFVGGKRAEVTHARKVFFVDNGIRNAVFGGFLSLPRRSDVGALTENLVFGEIVKIVNPLLDGLHYWRSKAGGEVDFVIEHQGRLLPVEVKAGDPRARLSRSARSFIDAYTPETFLVVGDGEPAEREQGSTRVRFVRTWEVASLVREFVGIGR